MARGRKRLIAGWSLVGLGSVVAMAVGVSRRYTIGKSWADDPTTLHTIRSLSLQGGWLMVSWERRNALPTTPANESRKLWLRTMQAFHDTHREPNNRLEWWQSDGFPFATIWNMNTAGRQIKGGRLLLWPLVLIAFASGPPLLLSARRAKKRNSPGLCPACGFNMNGLAVGAGCPECGEVAAASETPQGSSKVAGGTAPEHTP